MGSGLSALAAALLAVTACAAAQPSGGIYVALRDTPFDDARAVFVTFSEVGVQRRAERGFTSIPFPSGAAKRTCDLKRLARNQDILVEGPLEPGTYIRLRLALTAATLYLDAASTGPICAASIPPPRGRTVEVDADSVEVLLDHEFDVAAGRTSTITLDFEGRQSIVKTENGRYRLVPVVSVVTF